MKTRKSQNMSTVMESVRNRSPKLDHRIIETEPRRKLASSLIRMRRRAGLTQKQVAAEMGRDQAFVSRLESTSGAFPSPKTIANYARACRASAGYIFATQNGETEQLLTVPFGDDDEATTLLNAVREQQG